MDLDNYNRNTEQGLHVTSAAGVWASMIFGYGGMRTDADILILAPTLPTQWQSFRFRVRYRGALLEVRAGSGEVQVRAIDGGPVVVRLYGSDCEVDSEGVTVPLKQRGDQALNYAGVGRPRIAGSTVVRELEER
jgi:maltose phosphorylase